MCSFWYLCHLVSSLCTLQWSLISHNKRREVGMRIKLPKAEKKWEFIIVSRVFKISAAATAITQLGIRPKQWYLGAASPWGIERRDKFIFCEILSRKTLKFLGCTNYSIFKLFIGWSVTDMDSQLRGGISHLLWNDSSGNMVLVLEVLIQYDDINTSV